MNFDDFPAAHSMDSGWFAIDETGAIAHFDTGEAGALPHDAKFLTGEAGQAGEDLWRELVVPWIARNASSDAIPDGIECVAVFDTPAHADAGAAFMSAEGRPSPADKLLVDVWFDDTAQQQRFMALDGFLGFSPSIYSLWEDGVADLVPIALYDHGDWDIPGHYVRRNRPSLGAVIKLSEDVGQQMLRINVKFGEAEELNLADFFGNDECTSWADVDLRTGEALPRIKAESMIGRILRFFKG